MADYSDGKVGNCREDVLTVNQVSSFVIATQTTSTIFINELSQAGTDRTDYFEHDLMGDTFSKKAMNFRFFEFLLIASVFLVQGGLLVPEVNEPNYLAKARHYWNPQWCAGDFFLNTGDAHEVFYWSCGWLTLMFSLSNVAVIGRIITYGLLAAAWLYLSSATIPRPLYRALAAGVFVTLSSWGHMAGEWLVGGFEAKGISYGFVLLAYGAAVRGRWGASWILLGIATAFHAMVGGWAAVATVGVFFWQRSAGETAELKKVLPHAAVALLIACIGLWPAWNLNGATDRETLESASQIQVFTRLSHHLDPGEFFGSTSLPFITTFGFRFLALVAIWLVVSRCGPKTAEGRTLFRLVATSLAIAAVGLLVAAVSWFDKPTAASLLKFYWFRLSDVILPAGTALALSALVAANLTLKPVFTRWLSAGLITIVGVHLGHVLVERTWLPIPAADKKLVDDNLERFEDWKAVCRFVSMNTPPDAVFITPRGSHTFKWYAERGEVVTWKEMPQDAASVVRWWQRLENLHFRPNQWRVRLLRHGVEQIRELAAHYGATYLLASTEPRVALPAIYQNNSFVVYDLRQQDPPTRVQDP